MGAYFILTAAPLCDKPNDYQREEAENYERRVVIPRRLLVNRQYHYG
jgi:hypothetical protein